MTTMDNKELIPNEHDTARGEKELYSRQLLEQIKEFEEELMDLDLRF